MMERETEWEKDMKTDNLQREKIPKIIDPMQTKNHHFYNLYNSYTLT